MALKLDDISINTLLGNGSFISGDIKVNGFVRVDGDIDGNLETDGNIIIGENAKIRGNIVRFRMVESQDQVKHEMTKQEAQALVEYNDDIKNHRWASKPQIRKCDKVYNGKLVLCLGSEAT